MKDNENYLFDLGHKEKEESVKVEEVSEKEISLEKCSEQYYSKSLNLFETNKNIDGISESITKPANEKIISDNLDKTDPLDKIPNILKLSKNEKKLYMQEHEYKEDMNFAINKDGVFASSQVSLSDKIPFGETLRNARIAQNISYEKINEITKIRIQYLKYFEEEDFAQLPDSMYIKAYLKKICNIYQLSYENVHEKYLDVIEGGKPSKVIEVVKKVNSKPGAKITFLINYFREISIAAGSIAIICLFFILSKTEKKIPPVNLSIFVEKYTLPEYTFPVPLDELILNIK